MPNELKLTKSLIVAYEMIRANTETMCDLTMILTPLVKALEHEPLGRVYLKKQTDMMNELIQLKCDSLAAIDEEIQRLKDDA
jgi:hypothetical protein